MRWVGHVDMDAFFAGVEQLTRPTLAGRPVLVGGAGPRGTVAAASYEARAYGARSAMSMAAARRACPAAVVLPPRFELYRALSATVMSLLTEQTAGEIEAVALDEAFLELAPTGAAADVDAERIEELCNRLRTRVREATGLACSVGAGSGKQPAKIASRLAKPDGCRVLARDEELALLHGLEVRALWGIGPVAERTLHRIGVYTIGQLAALDVTDVVDLLGDAAGHGLHRLARGIDDRPVQARPEAKQVSAETTFEVDRHPGPRLNEALETMAAAAHARLLSSDRRARTVTVKVRARDFATTARSATLPTATDDAALLAGTARGLLPTAIAAGSAATQGVRLVGVSYSGLDSIHQDGLFPLPTSSTSDPEETQPAIREDTVEADPTPIHWQAGTDVAHPDYGHGWIQGAGLGRVTVRFETRSTGPGKTASFAENDNHLHPAEPLASFQ
jgi:DNA polymerase-4